MSTSNAVASSSKLPKPKHKLDKHHKSKITSDAPNGDSTVVPTKHKHKHKRDKSSIKGDKTGPFEHRRMRMRLSIPPRFSGDYMTGVREQLDGMVMRYVPQVQGVLLAHWEHTFLDDTVNMIDECPFGVADVQFETLIWAPKLGQKLFGSHSLSSPSHLSLLFSRTFNVSIPLQHIPLDMYEFQPTDPDELDEEADADTDSEDEDRAVIGSSGLNGGQVEEVGRWKVKETGKGVGEGGKGIEFTVIGMQVTNQMLSLTGSLLSDPTNPPPPPVPTHSAPHHRTSPSPTPDHIAPPIQARQPRPGQSRPIAPTKAQKYALVAEDTKEEVDEAFMNPRELKKRRKDEKKAKREERKERKAERVAEGVMLGGGEEAVGHSGLREVGETEGEGRKRKGDEAGGRNKRRKE